MVEIDKEKCIVCGACEDVCPEVFEIKNMKAHVKGKENSKNIEEARDMCPVDAIK